MTAAGGLASALLQGLAQLAARPLFIGWKIGGSAQPWEMGLHSR
jgi:hypothetical protein